MKNLSSDVPSGPPYILGFLFSNINIRYFIKVYKHIIGAVCYLLVLAILNWTYGFYIDPW